MHERNENGAQLFHVRPSDFHHFLCPQMETWIQPSPLERWKIQLTVDVAKYAFAFIILIIDMKEIKGEKEIK